MAQRYARGTVAWGLCKRCGLQFLLRNLVFDSYMPGLRVCRDCFDARQPQEYPVNVTDPIAVWRSTPDDPPYPAVVTATANQGSVAIAWTQPDPSGAARYETYTLMRAFSTDGVNYSAFVTLGVFPVTYYDANLADLAQSGNPAEDNGGIASQTLAYADNVTQIGFYEYRLTCADINGKGTASDPGVVQVTQLIPLRILEDGVNFRVLEDGVTFRELEQ